MRKHKFQPGTWIEREMFESKTFISLRGFAPQLLILILGKRQFIMHKNKSGKEKRVCTNCDSINFTYIEAKKRYGVEKKRLTRAIEQLLQKGFLRVVHQGGGYKQDKSIYALSDNWLFWQPGTVFETRNKSNISRGYCNPKKTNSTVGNAPHTRGRKRPPKRVF